MKTDSTLQNFLDRLAKSTTVVAYLLYYAIFYDSVNIGILAAQSQRARELLGRLQLAYENLPKMDATWYSCMEQG